MKVLILLAIVAVVVVLFYFFRANKEKYQMPDFSAVGTESDICPLGYVLACVSSDLVGIEINVPFPPDLPKPCSDNGIPLCLPHPDNIKPPSAEYLLRVL
jgi:hypothetical protein